MMKSIIYNLLFTILFLAPFVAFSQHPFEEEIPPLDSLLNREKIANEILKTSPSPIKEKMELGEINLMQGHLLIAELYIDQVLEVDSTHSLALYYKGYIRNTSRDFESGILILKKCLNYAREVDLLKRCNLELAYAFLEAAKEEPKNPMPMESIETPSYITPVKYENYLDSALYYNNIAYNLALFKCEILPNIGQVWELKKEREKAREKYLKYVECSKENANLGWYYIGNTYALEKKHFKAIENYNKAIKESSTYEDRYLAILGARATAYMYLYEEKKEKEFLRKARKDINECLEINSDFMPIKLLNEDLLILEGKKARK